MTRFGGIVAAAAMGAIGLAATPAQAQERQERRQQRTEISPYVEVGQVLASDFDEVLTYTTVAAGIDASVRTRRIEATISYNYQRRFDYQKNLADSDTHSGLARVAARVMPGFTVEGGAIATSTRVDQRGAASPTTVGNVANRAQIYSAYVGPSLSTRVGPIQASAAYRFGATKMEAPSIPSVTPGQPAVDVYDRSTSHSATASIGVKSGDLLPVGITVSGAWNRENASQLDQRFDGKYGRADAVLPIGRGIAVVAGVGYEKIEVSQKDALRDAGGRPVTDGAGRQVTDPTSPRRIAYDIDGIFWDAGVIYRPSRRMMLEARAGRRYGSMSYTGSLSWQMGSRTGLQVGVYDSVTTFGRQISGALAALPTSFDPVGDPFGSDFNGCVFGTVGASAGGCLSNVFASASTSAYRARGVDAVWVVNAGPTRFGAGAGYANRRYLSNDASVDGTTDQSIYGQVFVDQQLGPNSSIGGNIFASYFDSGLAGAENVMSGGINGRYSHSFGRLGATASLGVYGSKIRSETDFTAQALLGMRYQF